MSMKRIFAFVLFLFALIISSNVNADDIKPDSVTVVYKINIKEDIMPAAWRHIQRGFKEATDINSDIILIHLNTYGGMVNVADSIRTKILNSTIPVWVFIDNQAASAGALISIAADSIYMRQGGSIGAATVVNQTGEVAPDKYQSFMRSTMRATAEAKGKKVVVANGDTTHVWRRDPRIAEAMVDPSVYIEGIIDTGKVLTFTTDEAIRWGFCEGKAESVKEIFGLVGIENYKVVEFKPTLMDKVIGFLTNPMISGLLIMLIVGGLYFELQTPGVGFPLAVAVTAATFYFAPLYIEGLAEHYELIIFIIGLVLIAIEIFALPGFGIAGITGIVLVVIGLTVAMIDNDIFRDVRPFSWLEVFRPLVVVSLSLFLGLVSSIALSRKIITSPIFPGLALDSTLKQEDGYVGIDKHQKDMIGKEGVALTMLRPSGKVQIDDEIFDAISEEGFIDKNEKVSVVKDEAGQIYVVRK
jgi:membrane-bound serine protease (ClpP class)